MPDQHTDNNPSKQNPAEDPAPSLPPSDRISGREGMEDRLIARPVVDQEKLDAIKAILSQDGAIASECKPQDLEKLATVLSTRGVEATAESIERYLHPDLDSALGSPETAISQMSDLCDQVIDAIENGKQIAIYCDYDVDGTTAAAQVSRFLKSMGVDTGHFVSDRLGSGYGVSIQGINEIADAGYDVVLCLDQGSHAAEAMIQAKARNLQTLVIDHHGCGDDLSNIDAHVNPAQEGCGFQSGALCASGLANTFLRALKAKWEPARDIDSDALLPLTALGTVCDVMPLNTEVNRAIVQRGLSQFEDAEIPGLQALAEVAGIEGNPTATQVAFQIGPLMNAASRMEHADILLDLLTTEDLDHARGIANHLVELRTQVRQEVSRITEEIETALTSQDPPAIAMGDTSWHPGVIGIVSGRLAEKYNVPVCLMGGDINGTMTASGRSPAGYSLPGIFSEVGSDLIQGGGHDAAAGGRVPSDRLQEFCDAFVAQVRVETPAQEVSESQTMKPAADLSLSLPEISFGLLNTLALGEPYGHQNPAPTVLIENLTVDRVRPVKDQHLSVKLGDGRQSLSAFKGHTTDHPALQEGENISVTGTLDFNSYAGQKSVQLFIDKASRSESPEEEPTEHYYQPQSEIIDIQTPLALEQMVEDLSSCETLVIDVETVWDSQKGTHICLAQIFDPRNPPEGNRTYLVDGVAIADLKPLGELLENPDIEIIEHNSGFENARFLDLGIEQNAVSDTLDLAVTLLPHLPNHKLQTVASYLLGIDMTKGEQVSDWSKRPLTLEQRKYGTVDVEITWQIHKALKELEEAAEARFEEYSESMQTMNDFALALNQTSHELEALEADELRELTRIDEQVALIREEIVKRLNDGELGCDFSAGHAFSGSAKKTFDRNRFEIGLRSALADTPHLDSASELIDSVSFVKSQSIKGQLELLIENGFPLTQKQIQPLLKRCMIELSSGGNHQIKPLGLQGTQNESETDLVGTRVDLTGGMPELLQRASEAQKRQIEIATSHPSYVELLIQQNYLIDEIRSRVDRGERYVVPKGDEPQVKITKNYPIRGISVSQLRGALEALVPDNLEEWSGSIQEALEQAEGYVHSRIAQKTLREANLGIPTYPILHDAWVATGKRDSASIYISVV